MSGDTAPGSFGLATTAPLHLVRSPQHSSTCKRPAWPKQTPLPHDVGPQEEVLDFICSAGPPSGRLRLQCYPRSLEKWLGVRTSLFKLSCMFTLRQTVCTCNLAEEGIPSCSKSCKAAWYLQLQSHWCGQVSSLLKQTCEDTSLTVAIVHVFVLLSLPSRRAYMHNYTHLLTHLN